MFARITLGRACAKNARAIAFALMENSGTGAKNAAVQRDVSTGNKKANARNAEALVFVLTANTDIGAKSAISNK